MTAPTITIAMRRLGWIGRLFKLGKEGICLSEFIDHLVLIIVPILFPSTECSKACGVLPLMMLTSHPDAAAVRPDSSFGIIPCFAIPDSMRLRPCSNDNASISWLFTSSTPSTSVKKTKRSALSAEAISPAAVSALILRNSDP